MNGIDPAFPNVSGEHARVGEVEHDVWIAEYPGLTKREYFAALAMQGLCAAISDYSPNSGIPDGTTIVALDFQGLASEAIGMADALITALSAPKASP